MLGIADPDKQGGGLMRYIISRRSVRGYPLDDDCRTAGIIREADGAGNPRRYCSGYKDTATEEIKPDCLECKAYIDNIVPWKGERSRRIFTGNGKGRHMTNGEYIRGLSNEDLAYFISRLIDCETCPAEKTCNISVTRTCENCLTEWLDAERKA